ncbi:MAG: DNA polymerase III subunit delta [Pedobacter sp.]|nr:DNA polymerase III subunit delta [Chitinophagaceae bacterium]
MSAEKIITDFKKKNFKPIYWLEGDEPYFIDEVVNYAEHKILSESEANFNLTIFYGRDANWADVVNACRRYPMFADRQVVLLKEAQHMKDIEKLEGYLEKPLPSTVLVVGFKEKKLDGRGKMAKLVKKQEYFFSEKVKDYKLNEWVMGMIKNHGLDITNKALILLVDSIGNDLSRLQNEVEKLVVNLAGRKSITDDDIEKYIGISKEFNAFELQDALAKKDMAKAIRIIHYFEANPKAAPIQLILPTLYNYFSKVYSIFGLPDTNERTVATLFYNNSFAAKQALQTVNNYGYNGVERILLLLHHYNLRSIGINNGSADDANLMKELVVKMMA